MSRIFPLLSAAILSALLSGCASTTNPESLAQNDPYEPANRAMFDFDIKLDRVLASPIARGYNYAVPTPARDGLHNLLTNLNSPVVFANDLLQGETKRAGQTLWRAVLNSTFGIGGLMDVASKSGVPGHDEDFGQTLAVWGVGEGSYLVLPFVGPRPPRDMTGNIVDFGFDPLLYMQFKNSTTVMVVRGGLEVLDYRAANVETIDQIERSSIDFYATTRSLYRQHRNSEVRNGTPDADNLPEIQ